METLNLSRVSDEDRACVDAIAKRAGVNLRDCYQCGKCSAGCPMADDMDYTPQQIMHFLQMGLVDKALEARGPWVCAQCMVCSTRCPQQIDITAIMLEVRRESHAQGKRVVPESDVFETSFINGVRRGGKSNEQYLAAAYNLKSGHLLQDMDSAPAMFAKGIVGLAPHRVKDKAAVRTLVDKCLSGKDGD